MTKDEFIKELELIKRLEELGYIVEQVRNVNDHMKVSTHEATVCYFNVETLSIDSEYSGFHGLSRPERIKILDILYEFCKQEPVYQIKQSKELMGITFVKPQRSILSYSNTANKYLYNSLESRYKQTFTESEIEDLPQNIKAALNNGMLIQVSV